MGPPKAAIVLADGRSMLERVVAALGAVCRRVVLVGEAGGIPSALRHLHRIPDRLADRGPLGGLEALLASGLDSEYLISPCDLDQVVPEVFAYLVAPGVAAPAVLAVEGQAEVEPLIARYGTPVHPIVEDMIREGALAMRELARRTSAQVVRVPAELRHALHNVNRPEDLMHSGPRAMS